MNFNTQNNNLSTLVMSRVLLWLKRVLAMGNSDIGEIAVTDNEARELIESINNARREWIEAFINFDYVSEEEIVDYYTYKIKACQVRYEFYIRKAKEKGIKAAIPGPVIDPFKRQASGS